MNKEKCHYHVAIVSPHLFAIGLTKHKNIKLAQEKLRKKAKKLMGWVKNNHWKDQYNKSNSNIYICIYKCYCKDWKRKGDLI